MRAYREDKKKPSEAMNVDILAVLAAIKAFSIHQLFSSLSFVVMSVDEILLSPRFVFAVLGKK